MNDNATSTTLNADNEMIENEAALAEFDEDSLADDGLMDEEIEDDDESGDEDQSSQLPGQRVLEVIDVTHTVTEKESGLRIDKLASQVFTDFSRGQLQGWITDGSLLCNGKVERPKYRVKTADVLHLSTTLQQHSEDQPENIAIEVVYDCLLYTSPSPRDRG